MILRHCVLKCGLVMMPTLRQIKRLNQFLIDLYAMNISPEVIKFSRRGDKPFIIISVEPIHDLKMARWITIDWEGEVDDDTRPIF